MNVEAGRNEPTPTRAQADYRTALDQHDGIDADDARRDGQDRPPGQAGQSITFVRRILEDAEALRANPNLDPVRKSRALMLLARQAFDMIERDRSRDAQTRWQAISAMRQMLDEEREKLRANPDVDPIRRSRVLAEFMREDRRVIETRDRLVAEMHEGFDFGAMLEEIWKESEPERERKRRQYLSEQGDTSEPEDPAPKQS